MLLVDFENAKSYAPCHKKEYEVWLCKPPAGTIVINKFAHSEAMQKFEGKTFFTTDELHKMLEDNSQVYWELMKLAQSGLVYKVEEDDVVLSGTRGELWVTKLEVVTSKYLCKLENHWGTEWRTLFSRYGGTRSSKYYECGIPIDHVLPWVRVRTKVLESNLSFACFIPTEQVGVVSSKTAMLEFNVAGIEHGKGDFIVCSAIGNSPNLDDKWVVNGAVFSDTYECSDMLEHMVISRSEVDAIEPEPLFV